LLVVQRRRIGDKAAALDCALSGGQDDNAIKLPRRGPFLFSGYPLQGVSRAEADACRIRTASGSDFIPVQVKLNDILTPRPRSATGGSRVKLDFSFTLKSFLDLLRIGGFRRSVLDHLGCYPGINILVEQNIAHAA